MSTESKEPMETAPESARKRKSRVLLPALLSAGLLWMSHFPLGWSWLAWVALAPLVCLVRSLARPRRVYPAAWAGGLVFFWSALYWIQLADDRIYESVSLKAGLLNLAALATYCSLFFPLAIFLLRRLERARWPLVLTLPAVWTALEFLRAHVLTGFPWYFLGHTQHGFLALIQVADLGGAYAVTFLVAAVNACAFELLYQRPWFRRFFALPEPQPAARLAVSFVVASLLVGGACLYGLVRLGQENFLEGPKVALIQTNVPQSLRNQEALSDEMFSALVQSISERSPRQGKEFSENATYASFARSLEMSDRAAKDHPELIVWPETSFPIRWVEMPRGQPEEFSRRFAILFGARWQTRLLLGVNADLVDQEAQPRLHNSAVLIQPDRERAYVGRYDKIHRVPFGEYMPFREGLPFGRGLLKLMAPYDFDYDTYPGRELPRFPLGDYSFGVLICFEDSDPYLARQYVRTSGEPIADVLTRTLAGGMCDHLPLASGAPGVDFFINISNDGWFLGSSEHDEHLAICRFRAVECRRSIARAVNLGISAVIDGSGRVVGLPAPTWAESKKMEQVLTRAIPLDRRSSLYARWGDWLPALCLLVVGIGCLCRLAFRITSWLLERALSWWE